MIPTKKNAIDSNQNTQGWLTLLCKNDQWKPYQVCLKWFFIVEFFTSCYKEKIFCMFHSTKVSISLCSPYENSNTWTWAMYASSIATLFWLLCLNPFFHTKSTFEKNDFAMFWILIDWDNKVCFVLWIVHTTKKCGCNSLVPSH